MTCPNVTFVKTIGHGLLKSTSNAKTLYHYWGTYPSYNIITEGLVTDKTSYNDSDTTTNPAKTYNLTTTFYLPTTSYRAANSTIFTCIVPGQLTTKASPTRPATAASATSSTITSKKCPLEVVTTTTTKSTSATATLSSEASTPLFSSQPATPGSLTPSGQSPVTASGAVTAPARGSTQVALAPSSSNPFSNASLGPTQKLLSTITPSHKISNCNTASSLPCFWVDVQLKSNTLKNLMGTDLSTTQISDLQLTKINGTDTTFAYQYRREYGEGNLLPAILVDINNAWADYALCETTIPNGPGANNYPCRCGWTYAGGSCLQFVPLSTPATIAAGQTACQLVGAKLLQSYQLLIKNATEIRNMISFSCPTGWTTVLGKSGYVYCYKMGNQAMSWMNAEKDCQTKGGHLASFTNIDGTNGFNEFNQQMCPNGLYDAIEPWKPIWLGYNDYAANGQLVMADYTHLQLRMNYTSVISDDAMPINDDKNCVIWANKREPCQNAHGYLCQMDPSPAPNPCPVGWMFFSSYCYKLLDESKFDFSTGQSKCSSLNASMASFHSPYVWDKFKRYLMAVINLKQPNGQKFYESLYIGMNCSTDSPNGCKFTDQSSKNWVNFDATSPPVTRGIYCVVAAKSYNNSYLWRITDCTTPRGIVCRMTLPRTPPCPDGWDTVGQDCYVYPVPQQPVTFAEAEHRCHEIGGVLPNFYHLKSAETSAGTESLAGFIEYRSGLTYDVSNIWMGWSNYVYKNGTLWLSNAMNLVGSTSLYFAKSANLTDYTKNFALSSLSAAPAGDYNNWINVDLNTKANYICKLHNNTCENYQLYYQLPTTGQCYFSTNTTLPFAEANKYCEDRGAHLATFNTSEWASGTYFQYLRQLFINVQFTPTAWTGYVNFWGQTNSLEFISITYGRTDTDADVNGTWGKAWASGSPFPVSNISRCLAIDNSNGGHGFIDLDCSTARGFICKQRGSERQNAWVQYSGKTPRIDPFMYYAIKNGTPMTYMQATDECQAIGGQLPSFHSSAEISDFTRYRWVKRHLGFADQVSNVWIGLRRKDVNEIYWTWPNFASDNYNFSWWDSGQPEDNNEKLCVYSRDQPGSAYALNWRSASCDDKYSVICQIRNVSIKNPCTKPGSIWREAWNRCIIPMTSHKPVKYQKQIDAERICEKYGWTLPSFDNLAQWNSFALWANNSLASPRFASGDNETWPITNFWLGLQLKNETWQWQEQNPPIYNNSDMWNILPSTNKSCVLCDFTQVKQSPCDVQEKNLLCQERPPPQKWCPLPWLYVSDDISYALPSKGLIVTVSYNSALDVCKAMNGSLPSWHNDTEWNDFLYQIFDPIVHTPGVWTGLSNSNGDGQTWTWSDESNFDWNHWKPGQEPKSGGQCSVIDTSAVATNYSWKSESCNASKGYWIICQLRRVPPAKITTTSTTASTLLTSPIASVPTTSLTLTLITTTCPKSTTSTAAASTLSNTPMTTPTTTTSKIRTSLTDTSPTTAIMLSTLTSASTSTLPSTSTSILTMTPSASTGITTTAMLTDTQPSTPFVNYNLFKLINFPIESNDSIAKTSIINAAMPYLVSEIPTELQMQAGMQWASTFVSCSFNKVDCRVQSEFRFDFTAKFGSCFTYNYNQTDTRVVSHAGHQYGLRLVVSSDQGEYTCASESAGFKISLQSQPEDPFPETGGFYATSGVVTAVVLTRNIIRSRDNCVDNAEDATYYYKGAYTVEGCLRACYQRYVLGRCNCTDPRFAKPAKAEVCTLDDFTCLENLLSCGDGDMTQETNCNCKDACCRIEYKFFVTTSAINFQGPAWDLICNNVIGTAWNGSCSDYLEKNIAIIEMFYNHLSQVYFDEVDAYPLLLFLSEICSIMGLSLSITMIGTFELVVLLVNCLKEAFKARNID